METTLNIKGMHCPACVERLTKALKKVPGVRSAHVTLNPPEAHIESNGPVPVHGLDQAARAAGNYSVDGSTQAASTRETHHTHVEPEVVVAPGALTKPSLYPLILIVLYIAGVVALTTFLRTGWDTERAWAIFMNDFMAGFFLVFSFFKLLDVRGFADAYQSYDVIARHSRPYALAYPFIELALGIAYLLRWQPIITHWATLIIMLIGSVGVLQALLKKNAIRCACLGTALNLPMTTVTLVEDLGMAAMAAVMLLIHGVHT